MTPSELAKLEVYFRISDPSSDSEQQANSPEQNYTAAHWKVEGGDLSDETVYQAMRYLNALFGESEFSMKTAAGPRFVVPELRVMAPRKYSVIRLHIRRGTITEQAIRDASQYLETLCPDAQVHCRTVNHEEVADRLADRSGKA